MLTQTSCAANLNFVKLVQRPDTLKCVQKFRAVTTIFIYISRYNIL